MAARDARIEALQGQNEALKAKVAALAEIAFGGSERGGKGGNHPDAGDGSDGEDEDRGEPGSGPERPGGPSPEEGTGRPKRGQRPGASGHGRRRYEELKKKEVVHELDEDQRRCRRCGKAYEPIPGDEVSTEIEWRVEVYRIEHHRRRYQKACECEGSAALVVAPAPAKVIPKGLFSALAIAQVLIDKFALGRPLNKIIASLSLQGAHLAPGSVVGMLHKVAELLGPLHEAYLAKARKASWWNCDETPWACLLDPDAPPGKKRRWWAWVARADQVTVFVLAPTRAASVLDALLGADDEAVSGIVCSDMYSAYGCLDHLRFVHAWCWAHVRRHIIRAAASVKELRPWSESWLEAIAAMYKAWHARRDGTDDGAGLVAAVARIRARLDVQLSHPESLVPRARKVVEMIDHHWDGLVTFVDHPEISPDNNGAEGALRPEVLLRKACHGSGAPWSAELAASCFSVVATAAQWKLNPLTYLSEYLAACARSGGKAPTELGPFLPWSASPTDLQRWRSPP